MKKYISVYLKAGKNAATSYYRFYQYFKTIDADFKYNLMIPERKSKSFFPIARQPKWKQVFIFIYIYIRVLANLFSDLKRNPDYLVISRCIINRILPYSYIYIIKTLKRKKCKVIWDFDDNIIGFEIPRKSFDQMASLSDIIVVGSPLLRDMVNVSNRQKVRILPTTDGDMHHLVTDDIKESRNKELVNVVKVIWVGTFSTLQYVERICKALEEVGLRLTKLNKTLQFTVVCDKELMYNAQHFNLININWEKQTAIDEMLHSHIGIMPLEDNESTRGKCGFKLIQYLSVGLPIVGSMVGMNKMIINDTVGVGVEELEIDSWVDAILQIVSNDFHWRELSDCAYKEWEAKYNCTTNLNKWKDDLLDL